MLSSLFADEKCRFGAATTIKPSNGQRSSAKPTGSLLTSRSFPSLNRHRSGVRRTTVFARIGVVGASARYMQMQPNRKDLRLTAQLETRFADAVVFKVRRFQRNTLVRAKPLTKTSIDENIAPINKYAEY
jgi:hypothetical protein